MVGRVDALFLDPVKKKKKKEIAQLLGVSPATVTLLNDGKRNPSTQLINRFSEVLNVPAAQVWAHFNSGVACEQAN